MSQPKTIEDREYTKFVDSPARPNYSAIEVVVGNTTPIPVEIDQNVETDFADGSVSAVLAIYKTLSGVKGGNNNTTIDEATVIGISITGASDGNKVKYKIMGSHTDSSFTFALNAPIYLGTSGSLTSIAPSSGFRTQIGYSKGVGEIFINIQEPIIL
jgi:hypothetical protein